MNEFERITEKLKESARKAQEERLAALAAVEGKDPFSAEVRSVFGWSLREADLFSGHRLRTTAALQTAPEDWVAYAQERVGGSLLRELLDRNCERYCSEHLHLAGVPKRVRDILLEGLKPTPAVQRVKEFMIIQDQDPSKFCCVLSADKGLGKTVAAGYWLSQALHEVMSARTYTYPNQARWQTSSTLLAMSIYGDEFASVKFDGGPLVIDDLGTEYSDAKGAFTSKLDALIDARSSEYRPTFITTNTPGSRFVERYGERVADRMREGAKFYELQGKSLRGAP